MSEVIEESEEEQLDELSKTTTANYLYQAKVDKGYVHGGDMGKYAKARDKGLKRAEKKLGSKISKKVSDDASQDISSMKRNPNKSQYSRTYKVKEEIIPEAKVDKGRSDYGKASIRNYRRMGPGYTEPGMFDPEGKRRKT